MKVTPLSIPDVLLIKPRVFSDARGFFMESFNEKQFQEATGLDVHFVQDNHSRSTRGVLRGLHYQQPPHAQGKLIRVLQGKIFDVAVDIRPNSVTFGQWLSIELSEDEPTQLWVPPGFAHGFLVLSESADLFYKTTDYYAPGFEGCIRWDDPDLAIEWPHIESSHSYLLSDNDVRGLELSLVTPSFV